MIFEHHTVVVFDGLWFGPARIYECPLTVITFKRLSERTKIAALKLGFSPPIHLPERVPWDDGYLSDFWILDGETVEPAFKVHLPDVLDCDFTTKLFFDTSIDFYG